MAVNVHMMHRSLTANYDKEVIQNGRRLYLCNSSTFLAVTSSEVWERTVISFMFT